MNYPRNTMKDLTNFTMRIVLREKIVQDQENPRGNIAIEIDEVMIQIMKTNIVGHPEVQKVEEEVDIREIQGRSYLIL